MKRLSVAYSHAVNSATPRLFLWVASLLYGSVLVVGTYYNVVTGVISHTASWKFPLFVCCLLLLLAVEQAELRWFATGERAERRAATIGFLVARIVLFEMVSVADTSGLARVLYPLAPCIAYFSLGRKVSYGLVVLYMALFTGEMALFVPNWYRNQAAIGGVLMLFVGFLFALSMAHVAYEAEYDRRRAEGLLSELAVAHEQLKEHAAQATALATAEERNRLARDIHDGLGHYLTAINISLEKALAFRERNATTAEHALLDARRLTREALLDVRHSVGALRRASEAFSLTSALTSLVNTVNNGSITVHLEISGAESAFPQPTLMALYRAAQEALTNIQKHAAARTATLRVVLDECGARLTVDDDGQGFDTALLDCTPSTHSQRFGLQGLRERLEVLGGTLEVISQPMQGTCLVAHAPPRMA